MKSYKTRQLPNIEAEKDILNKESSKKLLLYSEKIKDITITPNSIPSGISTSQEYQINNTKLPKSKSSQKQNKSKNNYIIFKNYFSNKNDFGMEKNPKDLKNKVKKILSVDKIGKNNLYGNNIRKDNKNFIENNLEKKEIAKNEMNEMIKDFIDNNLQNNKNCNFFRLFKMKRKNQNIGNKADIFPPLYGNSPPLETEQNDIYKNKKEDKYINLLTKQNAENNTIHYRDALINSVNKKKLKENRIFIKIDEHFNKLSNDKSPKKLNYLFEIKNLKTNHNNENYLINKSANTKIFKNINNNINNDKLMQPIYKSLAYEKYKEKKEYSKTPNYTEKINYLNQKKNRAKIKLNTPNNNNIFVNKDEFNILKGKVNLKRKKTPNIFINNNTIQTKSNTKSNKINFCLDNNKIKNKRIEKVDDNILGDSFRDELNIIISDVNNSNKGKKDINLSENKKDYSIESEEEVKLNLNYNDESIEKAIPKEHEERINLIKKFNRPETSYGRQKK